MSCLVPISGVAGYFITATGRVFTSNRRWKKGLTELAQSGAGAGYRKVNIGEKRRLVHRLMLETFVGPAPRGHETRHLNGDKSDNDISNLEWATHATNMGDNVTHGVTTKGEANSMARLTDDAVRAIREATGTQREIASRHGVSQGLVCGIRKRKLWKHV